MSDQRENYKKLTAFFGAEYSSLKSYVNASIREGANSSAEDILQDVALKLFSGADRYSPIDNVAGFVYHSVRNRIIDILRRNQRSTRLVEHYPDERLKVTEQFPEGESGSREQLEEVLKREIMQLKPLYRQVILAIDIEGYSYKELAQETGVPEGTLMSRRHRAISILSKNMEPLKHK